MRETLRAYWLVVRVTFEVSRTQTLLALLETVSRALTALNPLFYGLFAAGAVERDGGLLAAAVVGLVGTTIVQLALQLVGESGRIKQLDLVGHAFTQRVASVMASIETLDHQESPELLDRLQLLRDYAGSAGEALNALLNLVNTVAWAIAGLTVAITADWRLIILAVLGIPRIFYGRWTTRWDQAIEEEGSPHRRLANQIVDSSQDVDAAAEIRVFGLQRELRRRIRDAVGRWQRPTIRYAGKYLLVDLINGLGYFGAAIGVMAWMLHDASLGTVSVQAVTIAITTIGTLQGISSTVVMTIGYSARATRSAKRYIWLLEYAEKIHARYSGTQPPPEHLARGIRLEQVGYRYLGADQDAVSDITVDLPAGRVVAIVGENGAGKSTLVKLLTGMYAPSRGRILLDDLPLDKVDLAAWRERCSGAFQDYATIEFTAGETVGVGDHHAVGDRHAVHRALVAGAADDVVDALPDGLRTQLGTTWPGGVDLSGGQWQRLAIARGMMRPEPLLLTLDEPTSALDAATEHALFERYTAAAHEARRGGAVTLLVTHRFSTVAAADIVLVLAHGRIVEIGTHQELIVAGGTYAELYNLQASGYR